MASNERWGGEWTEQKISTLRSYLQTFQTALKNTSFHRIYIDALAGDGTWRPNDSDTNMPEQERLLGFEIFEREASEIIREGSALAALSIEPSFDRYIFNDLSKKKTNSLRQRAAEKGISPRAIETRALDANSFIDEMCRIISPRQQRGVVLLDPWGMQVTWRTVQSIANTQCMDMWYLFPTQAVLRLLTRSGERPVSWSEKLDHCLGSSKWREEFYRPVRRAPDLFNYMESEEVQRQASFDSVEDFVVQRLKETFKGSVLEEPLRLGPKNRPHFSFCFASGNPHQKAKKLTNRLARAVVRANKQSN